MVKKLSRFGEWFEIILVALVIAFFVEKFVFGFAVVQGQSMEPTLKNKDRLFVFKCAYLFQQPQVGDLIIFTPPGNHGNGQLFVKRIVADEEDYFALKEGTLYRNDEEIKEEYINSEGYIDRVYPYLQGIVPEKAVFVMGDNRNDSNDSRNFGFLDTDRIKGRVLFRVWPLDELRLFIHQH
ncbi:signal peptidase I [Alkaliphilus hydrothermalis]|uniref:Signal peptidase I n=1 Tax=Alkaliphilus hydrothermalis TaxID=1482730 RepID=A0ABS2NNA9_9FIRM|nr:signal peptidase I [Alkaliphilus hydrothermalis]MBM7614431.1 signal peptidase I [Alkaliphilus hydrothermalis]